MVHIFLRTARSCSYALGLCRRGGSGSWRHGSLEASFGAWAMRAEINL